MNRIAQAACRYVQNPKQAIETLRQFVDRSTEIVRFDDKTKRWRFECGIEEYLDWWVQFRDCIEAIELASSRDETLKKLRFTLWTQYTHELNALNTRTEEWDCGGLYCKLYDDLRTISTQVAFEELLATNTSTQQISETDLLKLHFPTSKGQQKAIKILELMRQGLPQKDIAARVGLTKGRVSEYMAKLRELFPDLSPSLQSSETVRKTSRR